MRSLAILPYTELEGPNMAKADKTPQIVEEAAEARRILEVLYNETPQEEEIDF